MQPRPYVWNRSNSKAASRHGAPGLVARRVEPDGTVWATRGFALYRRPPEVDSFNFEARLPCPWNATALLHSAAVRSYLRKQDVAQPFWLASGSLLVSVGGWLWRRGSNERRFRRVFRLRFWGRGVGRGILDHGLVQLRSGRILFGEYCRNETRVPVRVYGSDDDGQSWRVMQEFPVVDGAGEFGTRLVDDLFAFSIGRTG